MGILMGPKSYVNWKAFFFSISWKVQKWSVATVPFSPAYCLKPGCIKKLIDKKQENLYKNIYIHVIKRVTECAHATWHWLKVATCQTITMSLNLLKITIQFPIKILQKEEVLEINKCSHVIDVCEFCIFNKFATINSSMTKNTKTTVTAAFCMSCSLNHVVFRLKILQMHIESKLGVWCEH